MGRPTPCHFMTVASTLYASRPLAEPLVGAAITLENPSHNPRFITRLSPARVIKITNNQQFQHVKLAFISYGRVKNRHSSSIASAVVDAKCPCPLRGGGKALFIVRLNQRPIVRGAVPAGAASLVFGMPAITTTPMKQHLPPSNSWGHPISLLRTQ